MRSYLVLGFIFLSISGCAGKDWRTASREPAGIAPEPTATREAVLQVYCAPTWGWRGWFAVHTWIAAKKTAEPAYTVYEVIGWRQYSGQSIVRIEKDAPDRYWYGQKPRLLADHQGKGVDEMIESVDRAARTYPWAGVYKAFPGPNSNTFIAWISRQVPELKLSLPFSAIGSGYLR
jgi:hypothetical protein